MRPADLDIVLYRGDSYHWQFRFWTDAAKTEPLDLTGVVAEAEIRMAPGSPTLLMTLECTVSLPNFVDVKLPADLWTGQFNTRSAAWDLQLTWPSEDVLTFVAGSVSIDPDVTETLPLPGVQIVPNTGQVVVSPGGPNSRANCT